MKKAVWQGLCIAAFTLLVIGLASGSAKAQWKVAGEGPSFIKLGFLFQGQLEFADNVSARTRGMKLEHEESQNLFVRRFRILMGGNITEKLSFFFETDSPNLGRYNTTAGQKIGTDVSNDGYVFIQDAFMTYSWSDALKIDAGMILVPDSHNSGQAATSLLTVDYGPYSFLSSRQTQSRVGRDYGVQARGYLFENHLEYRLGVLDGIRDLGTVTNHKPDHFNNAPFRYLARLVYYPLEADNGFFYSGTTLGAKKIVGIGISADVQDDFKAYGGDLFVDLPLASGDVFTFQVDYIYYDGGETFVALPAQNDWLVELGLYSKASRLGCFAQVAIEDFVQRKLGDENRYQVGLAYWANGHRTNLKLAYTWIVKMQPGLDDEEVYRDLWTLQYQVMMY